MIPRVSFRYRRSTDFMGRFGGGWNWALGFCASAGWRTIIVNLLVLSVRIEFPRKK